MMTYKQFNELYEDNDERLRSMTKEHVYDTYYDKIRPYLQVIAEFLTKDKPATKKQLQLALGVSPKVWNACSELFEEFGDYLTVEDSFMDLKSEIDLQKGLINTEYKNPKILEMQLVRYNEAYKPKGKEVQLDLPTVEVKFMNAGMSEEELGELFGEKEEDNL